MATHTTQWVSINTERFIAGLPGGSVGDPESFGQLVRRFESRCSETIRVFSLTTKQYSGKRQRRGYAKVHFTVDEGKERLNTSCDDKDGTHNSREAGCYRKKTSVSAFFLWEPG